MVLLKNEQTKLNDYRVGWLSWEDCMLDWGRSGMCTIKLNQQRSRLGGLVQSWRKSEALVLTR
jgi:hypothetical protein